MAINTKIVVEQLFENCKSDIEVEPSDVDPTTPRMESRRKEKKTARQKHFGENGESSALRHRMSLASSRTSSPKTKTISMSPISSRHFKFPIGYDLALEIYSHKLSRLEQLEIRNYENIYFLGADAKKIQVSKNSMMDLYDDDDYLYRVVPSDHIAYRYEILARPSLGKGTFAEVIKAFDHKEKRKVAIKIVRNEHIYLKQSREELRILQVLRKQDTTKNHNMVHFYEFFMFRNHMCISMELLGMNLYQVLKKNQFKGLGSTKILMVARCTLKCLELLYKSRIIHCDIKPENIMLKRNNDFSSVKVGDFGSSCYEQQQVYHYVQSRYYRAPEVMLGMRYGPAIDMWSLGCVLGELSSGYPIFGGKDEFDQMAAIEEVMGKVPAVMMAKTRANMSSVVAANKGRSPGTKPFSSVVHGDDQFRDFVKQMLEWDPHVRPSPTEVQEHRWIKGTTNTPSRVGSSKSQPKVDGYLSGRPGDRTTRMSLSP